MPKAEAKPEKQAKSRKSVPVAGRNAKGQFLPGVCGCPDAPGRPRMPEDLKQLAQANAPDALRIALRLMKDATSERVQLAAADTVIDRAYGKATQHIVGEMSITEHEADLIAQIKLYAQAVRESLEERGIKDVEGIAEVIALRYAKKLGESS